MFFKGPEQKLECLAKKLLCWETKPGAKIDENVVLASPLYVAMAD